MGLQLVKATKEKCKLRMIELGLPGAGKTYSALAIASSLAPGGKILLLDTEHGSASKYADQFEFFTHQVTDHDPRNLIKLIKEADKLGVEVLIIDSLSHSWHATIDIANQNKGGGPFGGWDKATPIQRELIENILACKCHVIATARMKSEYVIEPNEKGKMTPKKVGNKADSKGDIEFEFDIVGEFDTDHTMRVTKSRCSAVDGKDFHKPGEEFAKTVLAWLNNGTEKAEPSKSESSDPKPLKDTSSQTSKGDAFPSASTAAKQSETAKKQDAGKTEGKSASTKESGKAAISEKQENVSPASSVGGSTAGGNGSSSAKNADQTAAQKASAQEMGDLLKAGMANGWNRTQLSNHLYKTYNLTPATITDLTAAQAKEAKAFVSANKAGE